MPPKRSKRKTGSGETGGYNGDGSAVQHDNSDVFIEDDEDDDDDDDNDNDNEKAEKILYNDSSIDYFAKIVLGEMEKGKVVVDDDDTLTSEISSESASSIPHIESTCVTCQSQRCIEQGLQFPENVGGVAYFNHHDFEYRMGCRFAALIILEMLVQLSMNDDKTVDVLKNWFIQKPSLFFIKAFSAFRSFICSHKMKNINAQHIILGNLLKWFVKKPKVDHVLQDTAACLPFLKTMDYIAHLLEAQTNDGAISVRAPLIVILQPMALGANMQRSNDEILFDELRKKFGLTIIPTYLLPFSGYSRSNVNIDKEAIFRIKAESFSPRGIDRSVVELSGRSSSATSNTAEISTASFVGSSLGVQQEDVCSFMKKPVNTGPFESLGEASDAACDNFLCPTHIKERKTIWVVSADGERLIQVSATFGTTARNYLTSCLKRGQVKDASGCLKVPHLKVTAASPMFSIDPSMVFFIKNATTRGAQVFAFLLSKMLSQKNEGGGRGRGGGRGGGGGGGGREGKSSIVSPPSKVHLFVTHFMADVRAAAINAALKGASKGGSKVDSTIFISGSPNLGGFLPTNILTEVAKRTCIETMIQYATKTSTGSNANILENLKVSLADEHINNPVRTLPLSGISFKNGAISIMGLTSWNERPNAQPIEDIVPSEVLLHVLAKVPVTVLDDPDGIKNVPRQFVGAEQGRVVRVAQPWINLQVPLPSNQESKEADDELKDALEELESALKAEKDAAADADDDDD
jgi:hypothetical protein